MNQEEYNALHTFMNEMLCVRDRLEPILSGQIKRGRCLNGNAEAYGGTPGYRKTTLKDAREIAKVCQAIINRAYDKFDKDLE